MCECECHNEKKVPNKWQARQAILQVSSSNWQAQCYENYKSKSRSSVIIISRSLSSFQKKKKRSSLLNLLVDCKHVMLQVYLFWDVDQYYLGQKKKRTMLLMHKSESCDSEESGCLIQMRNRARTRLATSTAATSRIDALRRN